MDSEFSSSSSEASFYCLVREPERLGTFFALMLLGQARRVRSRPRAIDIDRYGGVARGRVCLSFHPF
jgi:hypothetical protein